MSHVIHSTIKIYGNAPKILTHNHLISVTKQRIMKMISDFGQFYFSCPESSAHIRHYVDPITGRAIPAQGFKD